MDRLIVKRRRRFNLKYKNRRNLLIVYVFKSHKFTYGQCIDTVNNKHIAYANTSKMGLGNRLRNAFLAGQKLGETLKELGHKEVIFDRSFYSYVGRVKSYIEGVVSGIS